MSHRKIIRSISFGIILKQYGNRRTVDIFITVKKLADRQSVKKAVLELQEGYQQYFEVNKEKICDTDYADETFENRKDYIVIKPNPHPS